MMGAEGLHNILAELKKYEVLELPEQNLVWCLGEIAIHLNQALVGAEQMPPLI